MFHFLGMLDGILGMLATLKSSIKDVKTRKKKKEVGISIVRGI